MNFSRPIRSRIALGLFVLFSLMSTPAYSAQSAKDWTILNALPDPIGYGGMMAGVINGQLVAAGGSQWDKPIWAKGTRLLSDRIFVLATPEGKWREHASRLPLPAGHFASAAASDAIYFAGGIGAEGPSRKAFKLQARGADFIGTPLPDLPEAVVYGAGVIFNGRFFVIGGVSDPAAKPASRAVWSLGIAGGGESAWKREADLPDTGLFVATASATANVVYVFGGMAYDSAGKAQPSRAAWRLKAGQWERLADLPAARAGANGPCPAFDGRILVIGGYAEIFGGAQREHPGFPAETLVYNIAANSWSPGPLLPSAPVGDRDASGDPGPLPMIGAPVAVWNDLAVVISGEVRIATRSPAVIAVRLPLRAEDFRHANSR